MVYFYKKYTDKSLFYPWGWVHGGGTPMLHNILYIMHA